MGSPLQSLHTYTQRTMKICVQGNLTLLVLIQWVKDSYLSELAAYTIDVIPETKGVYPQSDGSLAMAFDEYI